MKKREDSKKKECEPVEKKACYNLKKHPSATCTKYYPRECPDLDKYKKKCPPPIEVCKDLTIKDECKVKPKRQAALTIEDDDIVVIPRGKPPRCPTEENPCANDNKPTPKVCEVVDDRCGRQDDDD